MTIQDKDLLLVGVEEGWYDFEIDEDRNLFYRFFSEHGQQTAYIRIDGKMYVVPDGYEPVGLYPGLTDEQALSLMEDKTLSTHGYFPSHSENKVWENTALESFASRMDALGAYIKNPYADIFTGKQPQRRVPFKHAGFYTDNDKDEIERYHKQNDLYLAAQSRTSAHWLVVMKK